MTIKDDLHALVDQLAEAEAVDALGYLLVRTESHPDPAFIHECQRALAEALDPQAVHVAHEVVAAWLDTWGTPEEEPATAALDEHLRSLTQDASGP